MLASIQAFLFEVKRTQMTGGGDPRQVERFYVAAPDKVVAGERLRASQGILDEEVALLAELSPKRFGGWALSKARSGQHHD
jgi:hypothetical protein